MTVWLHHEIENNNNNKINLKLLLFLKFLNFLKKNSLFSSADDECKPLNETILSAKGEDKI